MPGPWSCALHEPEQQSAFVKQSSQATRQPPEGAHRFTPSLEAAQSREQQSLPIMQISPTWRAHAL